MPWNQVSIQRHQARTQNLTKHIIRYLNELDATPIQWEGPTLYFHKMLISSAINIPQLSSRINDPLFIERLYACLFTWGVHRFDNPNARLIAFNDFSEQVRNCCINLDNLSFYHLSSINNLEFHSIQTQICNIIDRIHIVVSNWPFVANTKLLHHLLPFLIPPMDRRYTLKYFLGRDDDNNNRVSYTFGALFESFWQIATSNKVTLENMCVDTWQTPLAWYTTVPKIIDNSLIVAIKKIKNHAEYM